MDRGADVVEHRINGKVTTSPKLIKEIENTSDGSVPRLLRSDSEWPSQDGVNRSSHIAILAGGRSDPNRPDETTKPLLQQAVREAVEQVLPRFGAKTLIAVDHEVGPASGAVEDWIVTLFENRELFSKAIGTVVDTWALYEIVSRVRKKLLSQKATKLNGGEQVRIAMPCGTLAMLCEEYVRRTYHPRAHLSTEWYSITREFWHGYVSPAHPNAILEYLVLVSTSKETYRFKVLGSGTVTEHSLRRGRLDTLLPTPSLFDD